MSLTRLQVQSLYPEVYDSFSLQASLPEAKYDEKVKFWEINGINCFDRWTVPYFLEREKEKKRPCLRLNYPPDGKCNDCSKNCCRYDKICFVCGQEGHGAFQTFPGGKLKGELKCTRHRTLVYQIAKIKLQYGLDEDQVRALFKLPPHNPQSAGALAVQSSLSSSQVAASLTSHKRMPGAPPPGSASAAAAAQASLKANQAQAAAAAEVEKNRPDKSSSNNSESIQNSQSFGDLSTGSGDYVHSSVAAIVSSPSQTVGSNLNSPGSVSNNNGNLDFLTNNSGGNNNNLTGDLSSVSLAGLNLGGGGDASSIFGFANNSSSSNNNNGFMGGSNSNNSNGGNSLVHLMASPGSSSNNNNNSNNFQQRVDITESDEFGVNAPVLRYTLSAMAREARGRSINDGSNNNNNNNSASGPLIGKGMFVSTRGGGGGGNRGPAGGGGGAAGAVTISEQVLIRAWRAYDFQNNSQVAAAAETLQAAVRAEIGQLRVLAQRSVHVAKVLHMGLVDIPVDITTASSGKLGSIVTEFSDLGQLDKFASTYFQSHPQGFCTTDLQNIAVQLIETLNTCHEMNVKHREIRPFNILVSRCTDPHYARQFGYGQATGNPQQGLILKFTNFTPLSVLAMHNIAHSAEIGSAPAPLSPDIEKWLAPEVDAETRRTGVRFQPTSDVWGLGLLLYFLASGGKVPFDSHAQVVEACSSNPDLRRTCLEKHGLHERMPVLYDLLERLLRPAYMRTELKVIRCHPFLWSTEMRRKLLVNFATATTPLLPAHLHLSPLAPHQLLNIPESIQNFSAAVEKIAPLYVFGSDGWVIQMSAALAEHIQPTKLKTEFWWSGVCLLQAIKNHLQQHTNDITSGSANSNANNAGRPNNSSLQNAMTTVLQMRSAFSGTSPPVGVLNPQQAVGAFIHQLTEVDFPRLLILLFELGGINGRWVWDGDEVSHVWN